jgi:hypothetical protein
MPVNGFDSVILLITLARATASLDADFAAKIVASGASARRFANAAATPDGAVAGSQPTGARRIFVAVAPIGTLYFRRHGA